MSIITHKRLGVALSGGGYRAAAFHIGTLKKLNELGVLPKINILSTISGGSITGAAYCLHKGDFSSFEQKMITAISTKSVIKYVLTSWLFLRAAVPLLLLFVATLALPFTVWRYFTVLPLLLLIFLIIRFQFRLLPISSIIEKAYNDFFFQGATLADLSEQPELAMGATNLQTSRHFTFSRRKMEDSAYAYYNPPIFFNGAQFPVSRAVMASSCIPSAFTPVSIDPVYFRDHSLSGTVDPKLVDGGIYDNQGIHKLTQDNSSYACNIVVVSDAGSLLPFQKAYNNTFTLLLRTVETFMARIKNFQMMQNIFQVPNKREIAYLSLGWDLENCLSGFYNNLISGNILPDVLKSHHLPEQWKQHPKSHQAEIVSYMEKRCHVNQILAKGLPTDRLEAIRHIDTNLSRLKLPLINDLISHAANLTELQVRLYCPSLLEE
jgi:NTE family protein